MWRKCILLKKDYEMWQSRYPKGLERRSRLLVALDSLIHDTGDGFLRKQWDSSLKEEGVPTHTSVEEGRWEEKC